MKPNFWVDFSRKYGFLNKFRKGFSFTIEGGKILKGFRVKLKGFSMEN